MKIKRVIFITVYIISLVFSVKGQDDLATTIIVLVNSARSQSNVSPLIQSSELTLAARRHSNDMANMGRLDHIGSDGSQFWERMIDAEYMLLSGAENVLVSFDINAQDVFTQWWNSIAHQTNMMNPDYIEIGVAYQQAPSGEYYFTMLLGSRVGVLFPTPTPSPMPPTATPFVPTFTPSPTQTFTATPLIPLTRTLSPLITPVYVTPLALNPTRTISPTIATPFAQKPDIRLIFDDEILTLVNISGQSLDLSNLRFQSQSGYIEAITWNTADLTTQLDRFPQGDCLQIWGIKRNRISDAPNICQIRHGWVAVNESKIFWQNVNSFNVFNGENVVALCDVTQGICDVKLDNVFLISEVTPTPPLNRDFRLSFNQDYLTILNISPNPIDLRGLKFQSPSGQLSIETWQTEFLTTSLSGLPAGDCLMVWTFGGQTYNPPDECDTRHGWIVIGDDADFWRDVSRFDVIRDNRVLAGCVTINTSCDVSLAGNLGDLSPTLQSFSSSVQSDVSEQSDTTSMDITLIYDSGSVTLVNSSGHIIDISSLAFESDSGVFVASQWDNGYLSRALQDFPSDDCVQVWGVNEPLQSSSSACQVRHGWVAVKQDMQFWRNVTIFRVRVGAQVIAVCEISMTQCQFNLP